MSGFKRFCMICFALMGIAVMAALILPWVGPWTHIATALLALDWYLLMLLTFAFISFVGFACVFIVAVRAHRQHDVRIWEHDGEVITLARAAVASQATYLVEQDGQLVASKVTVDARHRDRVDVTIQVQPHRSIDVAAEAEALSARLRTGLDRLCGGRLGALHLRFLAPLTATDIDADADQKNSAPEHHKSHAARGEVRVSGIAHASRHSLQVQTSTQAQVAEAVPANPANSAHVAVQETSVAPGAASAQPHEASINPLHPARPVERAGELEVFVEPAQANKQQPKPAPEPVADLASGLEHDTQEEAAQAAVELRAEPSPFIDDATQNSDQEER